MGWVGKSRRYHASLMHGTWGHSTTRKRRTYVDSERQDNNPHQNGRRLSLVGRGHLASGWQQLGVHPTAVSRMPTGGGDMKAGNDTTHTLKRGNSPRQRIQLEAD